MVSYDNAEVSFKKQIVIVWIYIINNFLPLSLQSFAAKGKYILDTQLGGFSMWEAGGDSNDILLDSIRQGGGY